MSISKFHTPNFHSMKKTTTTRCSVHYYQLASSRCRYNPSARSQFYQLAFRKRYNFLNNRNGVNIMISTMHMDAPDKQKNIKSFQKSIRELVEYSLCLNRRVKAFLRRGFNILLTKLIDGLLCWYRKVKTFQKRELQL